MPFFVTAATYIIKKKFVNRITCSCFSTLYFLTLAMLNKIKMLCPLLIFSQSDVLIQVVDTFTYLMTNSADPDQLASHAN